MQMKGLQKLVTLTGKLDLGTLGELAAFYEANKKDGEAVISTLERVYQQKTTNKK